MFRIHTKQLAAFEEANLRAFTLEMVTHIRRVLPDAVAGLDDEALEGALRRRLLKAFSYGITERLDALRYLECSYVLGWSDDEPDAEARAVLGRRELTAEQKMDVIEQRTATL